MEKPPVHSSMEGPPTHLRMGGPPAHLRMENQPGPSHMDSSPTSAQMETPPMHLMGGPPTQLRMENPPGLSHMDSSPTSARMETPPMHVMGGPPIQLRMENPPGPSHIMDTSPIRARMESPQIHLVGSPPGHLRMGASPPAMPAMGNSPAHSHMEHLPAMSMSPQTHSLMGSPPARSSMGTPPDSLRSSQRLSMCCSDMMRQASSLGGTGDFKCTSTTNTLATSASFHNAQPYEPSISWIGDFECGVPSAPQHVRIDFTPNEGDTEFMKKKCSDFWKFIHSREDLQGIMVSPTPDKYPFQNEKSESSNTPVTSSTSSTKTSKDIPVEKTALSMLEFAEDKGIVDQALDHKFCVSKCSIPLSSPPSSPRPSDTGTNKPVQFKGLIERRGSKARLQMSKPNLRAMCKELDEWDKSHPKSMEPPSHNPPICYTVLQRKTDFMK